MKTLFRFVLLVFALAIVSGCATHNIPLDTMSPNKISGDRISLFVDQDGTFYPTDWSDGYKMGTLNRSQRKRFSLIATAKSNGMEAELDAYEKDLLNSVSKCVSSADRVFILIHGFNNNEPEAVDAFRLIEDQIAFRENDVIVRFYWDGLTATGKSSRKLIGTGRIWNNAAGFSQLAGSEGLRDVLNAISEKEIIVIAHSRGASVVLSALSNPPYQQNFIDDTKKWLEINACFPLKENGNIISAIFLAPAVGRIDFRTTQYYDGDSESYRKLGRQLKRIHYTVNSKDPVLTKKILPSDKFNPTGLGCDFAEGQALNKHYGILEAYLMNMDDHAFPSYIENCAFKEMLRNCGAEVKK